MASEKGNILIICGQRKPNYLLIAVHLYTFMASFTCGCLFWTLLYSSYKYSELHSVQFKSVDEVSMAKLMQRSMELNGTIIERIYFEYQTRRAKSLAEKVRILCWVCTWKGHHKRKAVHVKSTWGRRCDKLLFVSEFPDRDLPTVPVEADASKLGLAMKTFHAFKYIYRNYYRKYDWFLKADDDTYVLVENLRKMLAAHSAEEPQYFGLHMKYTDERLNVNIAPDGYMTGAAYVLSRESLRRLATGPFKGGTPNCMFANNETGEDLLIGQCMHQVGVKPADTRDSEGNYRFFHFDVDTMVNGNLSEEYWYWRHVVWPHPEGNKKTKVPISFHYMAPHKFYLVESLLYNTKIFGVKHLQRIERENFSVWLPPIEDFYKNLNLRNMSVTQVNEVKEVK